MKKPPTAREWIDGLVRLGEAEIEAAVEVMRAEGLEANPGASRTFGNQSHLHQVARKVLEAVERLRRENGER